MTNYFTGAARQMLWLAVLCNLNPKFPHIVYQLLKRIRYLAFEVFEVDKDAKLFRLNAT